MQDSDFVKCAAISIVGFSIIVVAPLTFFYLLYKVLAYFLAL